MIFENRTVNGTLQCFYYFNRQRTAELRIFSATHFGLLVVLVFASMFLWFRQRKTFHLNERHGAIVAFSIIGLLFNGVTGPLSRLLGSDLPCLVDIMAYYMTVPVVVWPLIVRMFLWVNKVKFNYKLAQKLAEGGIGALSTYNSNLVWYRLRASTSMGIALTVAPLLLFGTAMYFVVDEACRQCSNFFSFGTYLFSGSVLMAVFILALGLYLNRHVPDPTGLRQDTQRGALGAVVLGFTGLLLQQLNVGGFSTENPQRFDFVSDVLSSLMQTKKS